MDTYKNIKVLLSLIIISVSCFGQKHFNYNYDYNIQYDGFATVIQLSDTGYVASGSSFIIGVGNNYHVIRTNKYGIKINETYIQIPQTEIVISSIKSIDDSTLIACGLIMDQDTNTTRYNRDVLLVKMTNNGDTLWTKRFRQGVGAVNNPDFEAGKMVLIANDGGFVIAGFTSYSINLGDQIYVIKTDSLGNLLWEQTYGGANSDDVFEILETNDKGFLLAGFTYSYGAGDRDGYLIKTDSLGNFEWQKTYGGGGNDGLSGISEAIDGNYLLSGWFNYNSTFLKPWLIKVNNSGNIVWDKTYGDNQVHGSLYQLHQLSDSTIVVFGNIKDTIGVPYAGLLMKTSYTGDSLWARKYKRATTQDDYFNGFCPTNDGGFIMAGQVPGQATPSSTQDGWLVKVDCMGADSITYYFGDTCYTNQIGIKEVVAIINEPLLMNNVPNPFNESTLIPYYLPENFITGEIIITDLTGRVLQKYNLDKGLNNVEFETNGLSNGVYYYTMLVDNKVYSSKKMIVLK